MPLTRVNAGTNEGSEHLASAGWHQEIMKGCGVVKD
jgi:hypothetical protein